MIYIYTLISVGIEKEEVIGRTSLETDCDFSVSGCTKEATTLL